MIHNASSTNYHDSYEYHGNTEIVLTRKRGDLTVWRDWILFDSAEEASEYFNNQCCDEEA
jgi:hypothetical protein